MTLGWNVTFNETVCIRHESAKIVKIRCHTWTTYVYVWVSCPLHYPNMFKDVYSNVEFSLTMYNGLSQPILSMINVKVTLFRLLETFCQTWWLNVQLWAVWINRTCIKLFCFFLSGYPAHQLSLRQIWKIHTGLCELNELRCILVGDLCSACDTIKKTHTWCLSMLYYTNCNSPFIKLLKINGLYYSNTKCTYQMLNPQLLKWTEQ